MIASLLAGFRALGRAWGLAVLVLALNVGLAALLAVPLAEVLEKDLSERPAASRMLYGFDVSWWHRWQESHPGWPSGFSPDILGVGFAFKNTDLLLHGRFPAGLLARKDKDDPGVDPLVLGLGLAYLLLQTFLAGGILGVWRGTQGRWTLRGLVHGSGFYFGRLFRVVLLALVADWILFQLNAPFARWADRRAIEAVSETGANAWTLARFSLLLLGLLAVHMVASFAKVIVVLEERASAVLAFVSALGFCLGNFIRCFGQYFVVSALGIGALALWGSLDAAWHTTGYKTQIVMLLLAQSLVLARIGLRLGLQAGQMALYKSVREVL